MNLRLFVTVTSASIGLTLGVMALLSYLRFDEFLLRLGVWWSG